MAQDARNDSPHQSAGSTTWMSRGFVAAVVAIAVLAFAVSVLVVLLITDDDGEEFNRSGPPRELSSSPEGSADPEAPSDLATSSCGLEGYEVSGTVTAAPEVTWDQTGAGMVPKSATAGPALQDDDTGLRTCYAHTPEGALMFAANMPSWSQAYLVDAAGAVDQYYAEGPGKDYVRELFGGLTRGQIAATNNLYLQIRGFQVIDYTGDSVVISIASLATDQSGDAGLWSVSTKLVWEDGDWRLRVAPDGSLDKEEISDLNGYVPWEGP